MLGGETNYTAGGSEDLISPNCIRVFIPLLYRLSPAHSAFNPLHILMCRSLLDAVTAALAGGATMVQVREKGVSGGAFLKEVQSVLQVGMS